MGGSEKKEVVSRARVAWNNSAVRSGAELDSCVIANLDAGCEVLICDRKVLASGRERVKIQMPVEGWLSSMFLEEELSDPEDEKQVEAVERKKQIFDAGPLSANVLKSLSTREGNSECYACGTGIRDALSKCENDGESAWANVREGIVLCWSCGERSGNGRSLELDAFTSSMLAVLVCGGNQRRNEFLNDEHYATALWALAEVPYSELVIEPNERRCAADLEREIRINMQLNHRVTITETHGNRAVIVRSDCDQLQAGDYVVGIGTKRVWRFHDVVARAKDEKAKRAKLYGRWRLVVRRIQPVVALEPASHPHAHTKVLVAPSSTRGEENIQGGGGSPKVALAPTSTPEEEEEEEEEKIQGGGGPESDEASAKDALGGSFSSYATHSSVMDYWHATPEHKADSHQEDDDEEEKAPPPSIKKESATMKQLAALVLGYDDEISPLLRRGPDNEAILRCGRIVGINAHRADLKYDQVLKDLETFRKPILVLLTPAIDKEAPFLTLTLEPGPLGIRLKETPEAVLVERVQPTSAAAVAGLRPGYALAMVDTLPVASLKHALDLLQWHRPCSATFLLSASVSVLKKKKHHDNALSTEDMTASASAVEGEEDPVLESDWVTAFTSSTE